MLLLLADSLRFYRGNSTFRRETSGQIDLNSFEDDRNPRGDTAGVLRDWGDRNRQESRMKGDGNKETAVKRARKRDITRYECNQRRSGGRFYAFPDIYCSRRSTAAR